MKTKFFISLSAMAMSLLLWSCDSGDDLNPYNFEIIEIPVTNEFTISAGEQTVKESLDKFSIDFLNAAFNKSELKDKSNFVISPLSAAYTLSLAANSFDEPFAQAVMRLFNAQNIDDINALCRKMMCYLMNGNNGVDMQLANSVWYETGQPSADYIKRINDNFFAGVYNVDFNKEETVDKINSWCYFKTKGMVRGILEKNSSLTERNFCLLSALYFSAVLEKKFDIKNSKKDEFLSVNGVRKVDMMYFPAKDIAYRKFKECQIVYLPFEGEDFYMTLVLPQLRADPHDVVSMLSYKYPTDDEFHTIDPDTYIYMARRGGDGAELLLPRFTLATEFCLGEVFDELGLPPASKLEYFGTPEVSCSISGRQKTMIKFDGKGTIAPAVTKETWFGELKAAFSHPFIFSLVNKTTGVDILTGYVGDIE